MLTSSVHTKKGFKLRKNELLLVLNSTYRAKQSLKSSVGLTRTDVEQNFEAAARFVWSIIVATGGELLSQKKFKRKVNQKIGFIVTVH